jgi:hypothetical protein
VGKAGKKVRETFMKLVLEHMPDYANYARKPDTGDSTESDRKKRKMTPPPHPKTDHSLLSSKLGQ